MTFWSTYISTAPTAGWNLQSMGLLGDTSEPNLNSKDLCSEGVLSPSASSVLPLTSAAQLLTTCRSGCYWCFFTINQNLEICGETSPLTFVVNIGLNLVLYKFSEWVGSAGPRNRLPPPTSFSLWGWYCGYPLEVRLSCWLVIWLSTLVLSFMMMESMWWFYHLLICYFSFVFSNWKNSLNDLMNFLDLLQEGF